ncbi:MAG: hypothetical protein ACW99U_13335 [Candidatus Thorarchaeota archaeon]|jgi:hypothetical protein
MPEKPRALSAEYVNAKMMRNLIKSQLPLLTYEQVRLLYDMVKRWAKEEEVS